MKFKTPILRYCYGSFTDRKDVEWFCFEQTHEVLGVAKMEIFRLIISDTPRKGYKEINVRYVDEQGEIFFCDAIRRDEERLKCSKWAYVDIHEAPQQLLYKKFPDLAKACNMGSNRTVTIWVKVKSYGEVMGYEKVVPYREPDLIKNY